MKSKDNTNKYNLVLGLEVHIQPKTNNKMFCGCSADIWKAKPNTHTCPTCLGLPGALPVPNFEAVKLTQLFGLSLGCTLNKQSRFDRKHYFYPDLPKGYQISQYKKPLCEGGSLKLDSGNIAEIDRIHLEEDAAKSFHENGKTLVDFNKSGMPLIELVTTPTFSSVSDAVDFCKKLQKILKHLNISDADMEKGQMRLEANISMKEENATELPNYRVEIKNINSFKFMEKAVNFEIKRQTEVLLNGGVLARENRGYNESKGETYRQRSKEEAHDYRYFPEPDIPPMEFSDGYIEELRKNLKETPQQKIENLISEYKISKELAEVLINIKGDAFVGKFKKLIELGIDSKKAANVLINRKDLQNKSAEEIKLIISEDENKLTDELKLEQVIKEIIIENPKSVEDFNKGKEAAIKFLLGRVMQKTQGKADPKVSLEILKKNLQK